MLIVNKTYRIVDDENDTVINIEKDNNSCYHWKVINADGDELGFVLTDLNMSDIFKAIKDMTNFVQKGYKKYEQNTYSWLSPQR